MGRAEQVSREEAQEKEYNSPYHHLIRDTGPGIAYISLLRIVSQIVVPEPGDAILDAGCGDGRLLLELGDRGAYLFGVDSSLKALRYAAGFNPQAMLSAQNIAELGFGNGSFSKIALLETLEHVPPDTVNRVLSELNRVLKPGGKLVVSVPTTLLRQPAKHYRHFRPSELRSLLERYFVVESLSGHHRRSHLYTFLVAFGDNRVWHLRAGLNKLLRWHFRRSLESAPPPRALRLIAVCRKESRSED
jgi:SAM-dependent methyltransferase